MKEYDRNGKEKRKSMLILRVSLTIIVLLILLAAGAYIYGYTHPIRLSGDVIEQEMGESFVPIDHIRRVWFGTPEEVGVQSQVDISKEGDYPVTYIWRGHQEKVTVKVRDTTPPKLVVKEYETDLVEEITPEKFVEKAEDLSEVKTYFGEEEDWSEEGTYTIVIVAEDASGNKNEKEVTLVRKKDEEKPKIEGVSDLSVKQGKTIDFSSGVSVTDNMDPAPTLEIHSETVDVTKPGSYKATYRAKDRSGNESEVVQKITVEANSEWTEKVVYLTFDDGPSKNTKRILDVLDRYQVKGTFFVTGNNQKENDMIVLAHKKGHAIGLHTYTHDYAEVYASEQSYFEDLRKISDMVEKLTGEKSVLIRFPGGSSNTVSKKYTPGLMTKLTKAVQEKGYHYFDWNCDSTDASGNNVPVAKLVANATSSNAQHINILMHDTDSKDTTVEALPQIIEHYRKLGYHFKALSKDSFAPHHHINN